MSVLKVYWPENESAVAETLPPAMAESPTVSNEPEIYSFVKWVDKLRQPDSQRLALRAQRLNAHQTCPDCHRAGVSPLMLNDGRMDSAGRLVPGSATLVGFHCEICSHEWPA
ncbi:MAG: hypothetical protein O2983_17165 [Planctomycetota bacterium]|nr:hypothetical protein [Planctomycetota bacterium]MDA1161336.1 hypothetical protein [Planctomycetota bacterium]